MSYTFDTKKALSLYKQKGGTTYFPKWLEQILNYAQDDDDINDPRELAYLLATGKIESDYSLQRWEADYVCGKAGVKYSNKPCQSALNYYCSTQGGKANYCKKGLDNRGLPYFGRGLVQLTWKSNYAKFGKQIGLGNKLVENPELVMNPENSYLLAVAFMKEKRGGVSAFDYVKKGDLTSARRRINGGTRKLSEVNSEYSKWLSILKASKTTRKKKSGRGLSSKGKRNLGKSVSKKWRTVAVIGVAALIIGGSVAIAIYAEKNKK